MALPEDLTTITVTGTYLNALGTALSGSVSFTPTAAVMDAAGEAVISELPVTATLTAGSFSIVLPCTDNTGLVPLGWLYTAVIAVPGAQQSFPCYLPSAFGPTVDITALAPVTGTVSPSGVTYLPSATVPPASNPTNGGGFLYCLDGALYWLGPAGSATLIAPA